MAQTGVFRYLDQDDPDSHTLGSSAESIKPLRDSIHSALWVIKELANGKDLLAPFIAISERKWLSVTASADPFSLVFSLNRLSSLKLPTFSGNKDREDVVDWLISVTKALFSTSGIPLDKALELCLDCFPRHSPAALWVNRLKLAYPALTFDQLAHTIVHRFRSNTSINLL